MIDVSMLESMLSLTLSEIQLAQFEVAMPSRPIFGPIVTSDGYVNLSVASERTFQNLAPRATAATGSTTRVSRSTATGATIGAS